MWSEPVLQMSAAVCPQFKKGIAEKDFFNPTDVPAFT